MAVSKWILFITYFSIVTYIVFLDPGRKGKPWNERQVHLIPFKNTVDSFSSLKHHSPEKRVTFFLASFFGNIIMFIPVAFFAFGLFGLNREIIVIGIGLAATLLIECLQYAFRVGVWDIDDVILNSTGVFIGIVIWKRFVPFIIKFRQT